MRWMLFGLHWARGKPKGMRLNLGKNGANHSGEVATAHE